MQFIRKESNPSGSYPSIQNSGKTIPEGCALWPDSLDTTEFFSYNGFVTLTIENIDGIDTVIGYNPNVEAWEGWKNSLPVEEPVTTPAAPTIEERVSAMEDQLAMTDDALIQLYEMIGGN